MDINQRNPAGQNVGLIGLRHHDARVLMPRHIVEARVVVALKACRRFSTYMLNGIAGDFGTQDWLNGVQKSRIM